MPNIVNDLIVSQEKIIFPLLHVKLSLMKQFVKGLNTGGECFQHIFYVLAGLSFEKIKAGFFNRSQIRALVRDQEFSRKMNDKERTAGLSSAAVIRQTFSLIKKLTTMKPLQRICCQLLAILDVT